MLKPDEIIDAGFAALKGAQPTRTPAELAIKAKRLARRAKIVRATLGTAGCLAIGGMLAIVLQPTSALAALRESARLTAAQPIVHIRFDRQDTLRNPTSPPWPTVPATDIWKFPDHYIRRDGHTMFEAFRDGRTLAYDDRFPVGYRSTYDAGKDRLWTFDGTIGMELSGVHRNPPSVRTVVRNGARLTDYEWHDVDGMQHGTTVHTYVDPDSKLVRFSESDTLSDNGDTSHGSAAVDYPSASTAQREAPCFPAGLKFQTKQEILRDFDSTISRPDQSKVLAGIRTTLYGVVIYKNVPDGLGVEVITLGGAGPDFGSGHQPEIVGVQLLPVKKSQWFPPIADPQNVRHGSFPLLAGRNYIVNQSDDLLLRAPSRIIVRVPVWRLSRSTIEREGKTVHLHDFVGYVTFTTSKIYSNIGDFDLNFFGNYHARS